MPVSATKKPPVALEMFENVVTAGSKPLVGSGGYSSKLGEPGDAGTPPVSRDSALSVPLGVIEPVHVPESKVNNLAPFERYIASTVLRAGPSGLLSASVNNNALPPFLSMLPATSSAALLASGQSPPPSANRELTTLRRVA